MRPVKLPFRLQAILLLLLGLFLTGADCEKERLEELENGLVVRDGLDLHRCDWPGSFSADETLEDPTVLSDAVAQLNTWADTDGVDRMWAQIDDVDPSITVEVGYVPVDVWDPTNPEAGEAGIAEIAYDENGCITFCAITLSSDIAYDRDTLLQVLLHEGLHCYGLDDDPGIDVTVDLRSIMGKPIDPVGELTMHDFELLRRTYDEEGE